VNVVRLIAEIAGLAILGLAGWYWRSKLKLWLLALLDWSIGKSEFWDVAETYCNEVAVLWFVFPTLDSLYDRAKDKPPPSTNSILMSFAVSLGFFIAAVYCKKNAEKLEAQEKLRKGAK